MPVIVNGSTGISGVDGSAGTPALQGSDANTGIRFDTDVISLVTGGSDRLYIDSSGNIGIGTASPLTALQTDINSAVEWTASANLSNATNIPSVALYIANTDTSITETETSLLLSAGGSGSGQHSIVVKRTATNAGDLIFRRRSGATTSAESLRIDSSGRLLVGTSTARAISTGNFHIQSEGLGAEAGISTTRNANSAAGSNIRFVKTRGTTIGSTTVVQSGDGLGVLGWWGTDGTNAVEAASISTEVDGTPGANDMPGRLVFSTTADGASSSTERMRITKDGSVFLGNTTYSASTNMVGFGNLAPGDTQAQFLVANTEATDAAALAVFNRHASDGRLVQFRQANTTEGTISVSGTTVTYGGGHLARWSQLPNDEDPSSILKGTVMSNLDEMCEWGDEDNEQLNKTKISDVEGDPNVAGVFVTTSFDEEGPKDFFVAMTGDMVIRIAAGTTVKRGDLLMSAGDGTAKPQGDGFVQDKTVAKVTSTNVSCTYDDGSYCVPCVLMAC